MSTLWRNITQSKYYLIPDDQTIPAGEVMLTDLLGKDWLVDGTAITAFEISESEGREVMLAQLENSFLQAKDTLSSYLGMLVQEAKTKKPDVPLERKSSKLVTDMLGFSADDVQHNPDKAKAGLERLFSGIKDVVEGIGSSNPTNQEAARNQLRLLRDKLSEHGIETDDTFEQIPDRLRDKFFVPDESERLRREAAGLERWAAQIVQVSETVGQQLQEEATKLKDKASNSQYEP